MMVRYRQEAVNVPTVARVPLLCLTTDQVRAMFVRVTAHLYRRTLSNEERRGPINVEEVSITRLNGLLRMSLLNRLIR